jgi:hypothetical protein
MSGRRASSGLRPRLQPVRPTEPQPEREQFCTFGIGHLRVRADRFHQQNLGELESLLCGESIAPTRL